ncbi:DUF885 domain-containing protein [Steroidobacter sp.]|uniref:DUF885 domain-containing protein n=1 Tax=Steroidobacter sp. TaxID=1978227 RepID=UPI001A61BFB7|nr:DUF885 domain-containing protein [Steroidobacter sp.]MBL8269127.1 DUF885 domain-containing protein [Steroidobacter sp.]
MQRTKLLAVLAYSSLLPCLALNVPVSQANQAPASNQAATPSRSPVDGFFARFTDEWVRADPDLATSARYFSGDEQNVLEQQLTPRTRAYTLDRIKRAKRGLADLQKFDRSKMNESQRVSAELMQWQLESIVAREAFLDFDFPLDQFSGANVGLVESLTLRHPLTKPGDAANYVARMKQLSTRMDETVSEARQLIAKKMLPPRFIVETTLTQMRAFSDVAPAQNPLVTAFAQRIQTIEGLSSSQRSELQGQATRIVTEQVYPSWRRAIALLEGILPNTSNDAGLWRFQGGDQAYAFALGQYTTTKLTAEEIHQIGLQQVARIEAEMDVIFRKLGRTQGSVPERIKKLRADLTYEDPTSDSSRAEIMQDIDAFIADALKRSPALFDLQPKSPVIAQPFPRFREASAAANYNRAPLDGSRSAIFQMPLRPERMTKLGLRTLVYHETVPGHHFQIAIEQENTDLPKFRQARVLGGISAMSEGWALYAERLVAENGWYEGDPEGLLGMLDAQLFRARRLVVDTGLHAKKWTRQQAIDYGIEASEIERYVVMPGQACAYMIGQLEILQLRDRARTTLGDKFLPQQFHNVVLRTGTAPLELLGREVDRYIAGAAAN